MIGKISFPHNIDVGNEGMSEIQQYIIKVYRDINIINILTLSPNFRKT